MYIKGGIKVFKKKIEQVKDLIENGGEGENKKKIENLVVFIIILIVTVLVINMVWGNNDKKQVTNTSYTQLASKEENIVNQSNITETNGYNLEQDLEDILSKISGTGHVKVLLTYSESSQIVPVSNQKYKETQTQENDKSGGTRTIEETDKTVEIIYQENNGQKELVTQKVIMPKIEGALILAKGANNASVKTNIIQAVEALTGLATHKIQVLQMED